MKEIRDDLVIAQKERDEERVKMEQKKIGCGKVICSNLDYDGKMVVCGKYGDFLCDECNKLKMEEDKKGKDI